MGRDRHDSGRQPVEGEDMPRRFHPADVQMTVARARARAHNALGMLPGARPATIVVDLTGSFPARARQPLSRLALHGRFGSAALTLEELSDKIRALSDAPWLRRVILRVHGVRVDRATAYAVRARIHALRRSGKRTTAVLTTIGPTEYYIASAASEVVVPESADVQLYGVGVSVVFMRDALAKLGIRFEKLAIEEYKTAFDEFVRQDMSAAHREQLEALLSSFERHYVEDIARDRRLSPEDLRAAIDEGVTSAARLKELGLVDRIAYEDDLAGNDASPLQDASRVLRSPVPSRGKRIAMVSLVGAIVPGRSRRMPPPLSSLFPRTSGSETIVDCLRAAEADAKTVAVVVSVDSGGGSAIASDLIWRELARIARKKPVVGVMCGIAASGGYYVLAGASHLIAAPTTITGSIGVVTGKVVADRLLERLGLHAELLQRGRFAHLRNPARPLTEDQRALLHRGNREIYDRFVARVAAGRKMTPERVDQIGRGRIWSGADAFRLGLVDELGDLQNGIERACDLGGASRDAPVWEARGPTDSVVHPGGRRTELLQLIEAMTIDAHLLWCPVFLAIQ
jgi:protease-4